jgi:hypothetical protein
MSGDTHIENLQAGSAVIGGEGHIIIGTSGTINNFSDEAAIRAELQSMLDELLRKVADTRAEPEIRQLAAQARAEADRPAPRKARLTKLMKAVIDGVGKAGAVAQAALNVLGVINKIPW